MIATVLNQCQHVFHNNHDINHFQFSTAVSIVLIIIIVIVVYFYLLLLIVIVIVIVIVVVDNIFMVKFIYFSVPLAFVSQN